ncbi:hypothetical protein GCM10027615_57080 [Plantactinospora veratri]
MVVTRESSGPRSTSGRPPGLVTLPPPGVGRPAVTGSKRMMRDNHHLMPLDAVILLYPASGVIRMGGARSPDPTGGAGSARRGRLRAGPDGDAKHSIAGVRQLS